MPYLAREVLAEWDQSALAREVRLEAGTADVVVADYMLPGALCGAEASFRPSVALVHTLYAANLDGDGGLLPMQMAATVDGTAAVRRELDLAPVASFGALLDRQSTLLVTCPEALDLPGPRAANVRYVGPALEEAGPDAGWRPPGVDDGRPLVVVGLGTTPMDEGPVLQRLLTALGDAPARVIVTLGDHLDPAALDVPDNVHLSGYVRHAAVLPVGIGHGEPRRARQRAGRARPRRAAGLRPAGSGTAAERGRRRAGRGGLHGRADVGTRRAPRRGDAGAVGHGAAGGRGAHGGGDRCPARGR